LVVRPVTRTPEGGSNEDVAPLAGTTGGAGRPVVQRWTAVRWARPGPRVRGGTGTERAWVGMSDTQCQLCAVGPGGVVPVSGPCLDCRWCGDAAQWTWSFDGEPHTDLGAWCLQDDWRLCDTCHTMTLSGDDAALLDRTLAALAGRASYPYATTFVRELEAARIAHWIERRTTYRHVPSGTVHVSTTGRS
jgi:hypothetical protein